MTQAQIAGVDVASIGEVHGQTEGAQSYTYNDEIEQVYKRLIIYRLMARRLSVRYWWVMQRRFAILSSLQIKNKMICLFPEKPISAGSYLNVADDPLCNGC
ncbi:hypothetical protein O9992_26955 [Vibrio lentus]|nr:hypothetical protein [Vibrio lentus]